MTAELKVCTKCHLELPITEFVVVDKARGFRRGHCRSCESARVRAYYAENAEYRARQHANSKKNAQNNPMRPVYSRRALLKGKYGITHDQYNQLLANQDGKCALCGASEHGRKARPDQSGRKWLDESWPVDHCHQNGHVRGLLCHPCNVQLGGWEVLLEKVGAAKVLEYLTRPSPVLALPVVATAADVRATARYVEELPPRYVRHTCSVEGCDIQAHGDGFCRKHWERFRRNGTPGGLEALPKGKLKGDTHYKTTLTEAQAREIKFGSDRGADAARRFNVSPAVVNDIRHNRTWKHLGPIDGGGVISEELSQTLLDLMPQVYTQEQHD
jgi:hypothetical protein